jgi:RNA polymerase sigma-70 factor (ECF subfamily)
MAAAEMTELLRRMACGDKEAEAELLPRVYRELRRIAAAYLRRERPDHTLQATALVHEAYLRLAADQGVDWKNRAHFFKLAAQLMRHILVDYARLRGADKRGGKEQRAAFDENLVVSPQQCGLILDVDRALGRLAELNPRQARVVEMRFFSGLGEEEIAEALGVSSKTVKRDWAMARAWLFGELS